MPEHNSGQMGATMRLGKRKTLFKTSNSLISKYNQCTCIAYVWIPLNMVEAVDIQMY